jgi:hypothetical protein
VALNQTLIQKTATKIPSATAAVETNVARSPLGQPVVAGVQARMKVPGD